MSDPTCISVIIPTLNEADTLDPTLRRLQQQTGPFETIVVDGGSEDATRSVARSWSATVLQAPQGRASQMNRGAEAATGHIYLFLHADTLLPPQGLTKIRHTLDEPDASSGIFRLQFDTSSPLLRFYAWCTRWPWIRLCFGDRALFAGRSAFEAVEGFPDWPLFEDLEFAARLNEHGGFRFLDAPVTTSARRFYRHGALQQQLRNLYLWGHYMWGTAPERVAHLYHPPTPNPETQSHS